MNKTKFSPKTIIILLISILIAGAGFWFFVYQPRFEKKRLVQARSRVEGGDWRTAIPILEKLVHSRVPAKERDKARLYLARSYTNLGDYGKAFPLWAEMTQDPASSHREEAGFYLGWIAEKEGDYEEAERILNDHARRYPRSFWGGEVQLTLARVKKASRQLEEAREACRKVLVDFPASPVVEEARKELGELNLRLLFSPEINEVSREYTVKTGDSLTAIAARFHTNPELLRKMNRMQGDLIRPGQKLRVPSHQFDVVVNKSQNTLMLIYGGEFFKIYSVGTGKQNSTPEGVFTITTRLVDPPWYHGGKLIPPDDPRNILGSRWMGFADPNAEYGIHGTTEPQTIGSQSSAGCIRMHNGDVEEIFDLLPRGMRVTVVE